MAIRNERLEEFEEFIRYRKVGLVGLGVSNLPLIEYLHEKKARISVFDEKPIDEFDQELIEKLKQYEVEMFFGKDALSKIKRHAILFRSPSILPTRPEIANQINNGTIVTTEIEMLVKMCLAPIIGITGSEGKTTTSTMIYNILRYANKKAYLGGNIGVPLFAKLSEIKPEDIVVLELSSFQLMDMEVSPEVAVITNITPNHLNIHKDYKEYIDSKKNIFLSQGENDLLILNYDCEETKKCEKQAKGKVKFFSSSSMLDNGYIIEDYLIKEVKNKKKKIVLDTRFTKLKGMHNYENMCCALAATAPFVDQSIAVKALEDFEGVEHRLEYVKTIYNAKWYNDSASSSPTRTIAGLNAFDEDIILIAGGYDKNLDYSPLGKPIVDKCKGLILMRQTTNKIKEAVNKELAKTGKLLDIYEVETLSLAIETAKKISKPNQVVLFSPASASFDMFKNAYDRGNKFKELVNKM